MRAKSLIDGHIHGRGVLGLEPRGQSGSDSPLAGASFRQNSGPSSRTSPQNQGRVFARSVQCHALRVTVTLAHPVHPVLAWQMTGSDARWKRAPMGVVLAVLADPGRTPKGAFRRTCRKCSGRTARSTPGTIPGQAPGIPPRLANTEPRNVHQALAYREIRKQDSGAGGPSVTGSDWSGVFRFPYENVPPQPGKPVKCFPENQYPSA